MTQFLELRTLRCLDYYFDYYSHLSTESYTIFEKAAEAKSTLVDSSGVIEPKIAFDLADRVAKMHDIDIADPLRELLKSSWKRTFCANSLKRDCSRKICSSRCHFRR